MAGDTFTVERSAEIGAPPERVWAALVDFHEWPKWSPWEELDPEVRRTYEGPDSGVGTAYSWEGNRKAGAGCMEITEATAPSSLIIDLRFLKPFKSENTTRFTLAPSGERTRVTWTMTGPKSFMTRVMGIFKSMDKMIGPDFEKGLQQLDAYVTA
jgi:uncharacterized protein YndB with AHSA1/START domain